MTFELRPHQTKSIAEIKANFRAGLRSGVVCCPTGGGKTAVGVDGVIVPATAKGRVCWFVVHSKALIKQTAKKLDSLDIRNYSIAQAGSRRFNPNAQIQVCSIGSMSHKRMATMRPPDIIIVDECHRVTPENMFGQLLARYPDAYHIGLTATPARLDGKGLGRSFKFMVVSATISELIRLCYLVPPRVWKGPKIDLSEVKTSHGDYNEKQLGETMNKAKLVGDIVTEWLEHGEDRPTVCFAVNVEHSKNITASFTLRGITAAHIDASTPDFLREELIAKVRSGEVKVLSSVGVFTEGFDLPCVGCVIFARPTKSLSLYIQMGGRGLRPVNGIAEEGENCIVLDHAGLTNMHGHLTEDREWSLADGVKKKMKPREYKCPECDVELGTWPSVCPECGADLRQVPEARKLVVDVQTRLVEDTAPVPTKEELDKELEKRQACYNRLEEHYFLTGQRADVVGFKFRERFGEFPKKADREKSNHRIEFKYDHDKHKWTASWKKEASDINQLLAEAL